MGLLSGVLTEQATYWEFLGADDFGGSLFKSPILVSVRWEDKSSLMVDADGQERTTKSMIWYDIPEDIPVNSFLALGDETAESDPKILVNAYLVKEVSSMLDVSGKDKIRWVAV